MHSCFRVLTYPGAGFCSPPVLLFRTLACFFCQQDSGLFLAESEKMRLLCQQGSGQGIQVRSVPALTQLFGKGFETLSSLCGRGGSSGHRLL